MNVTEETPATTPMVDTATVRGDPAARRTGLFLFITLTAVTIGAALGIGLGNISHSRYFPSASQADVLNQFPDAITAFNETSFERNVREISPKTREFWIWMNRPVD